MILFKKRLLNIFLLTIFISSFSLYKKSNAIENSNQNFLFLQSIQNLSADYKQTQFDGQKNIITDGKIAVKKPDNIMLTYTDKNMKLKLISINGNIKMIDEDLGQTTYIDNQYSELMQFFTKNLKAEKLITNKNGDLCINFKHFDNNMEACLKIDLKQQTLIGINVLLKDEENKKQNNKYEVMNIVFANVKINKGVDDDVFVVKDNRIFNDEDDL